MFRKLNEMVNSAANSVENALTNSNPQRTQAVNSLMNMGFTRQQANHALDATNGNVDRAAELLLMQGSPAPAPAPRARSPPRPPNVNTEDAQLQRAMEESLALERQRQQQERQPQSAAANRAGQAALARAQANKYNTAKKKPSPPAAQPKAPPTAAARPTSPKRNYNETLLANTHPDVKVIPKLADKTKEEQVLRCADRLKGHPQAVDTLHRALHTIRNNPHEDKYRKIDQSTVGYQRSLANAPGAQDLLLAMSFKKRHHNQQMLVLERSSVDPALLYLGISALEQTKLTPEYQTAKARAVFDKELQDYLMGANASEQEAIARANHMSKCPSEPADGRGALIQVKLNDQTTVRRRFDGDDTLHDVVHWLGGHASVIYERLTQTNKEWSLVDLNRYPVQAMDCTNQLHLTLQYIGCWPSGKLELMPSSLLEEENSAGRGSARGLGAAPADAL